MYSLENATILGSPLTALIYSPYKEIARLVCLVIETLPSYGAFVVLLRRYNIHHTNMEKFKYRKQRYAYRLQLYYDSNSIDRHTFQDGLKRERGLSLYCIEGMYMGLVVRHVLYC